jgi:antitoxin MazE
MVTKIQKWGNSQGLRLSRHVLEEANLSTGDNVSVTVKNGTIVITPVKITHGRYNLEELVSHITEEHQAGEIDWGKPVGKEVW